MAGSHRAVRSAKLAEARAGATMEVALLWLAECWTEEREAALEAEPEAPVTANLEHRSRWAADRSGTARTHPSYAR